MRHRQPAICIRAIDYSETSQVLRFFTRDTGVVPLLAKGSKRPRSSTGGALDLLCEGQLVFSQPPSGAMGALIEFTETTSHLALRSDARRLNAALYMIELIGAMLAEADPHPDAFDLLHNALERLGEGDAPTGAVLAYFQWRMLRHAGLLGQLRRCAACGGDVGRGGNVYFSADQGGLLCPACEGACVEKFRLDAATLTGLASLAAAQGRARTAIKDTMGTKETLTDNQATGVNRLLDYHIAYQLGKPLKMTRHAIR